MPRCYACALPPGQTKYGTANYYFSGPELEDSLEEVAITVAFHPPCYVAFAGWYETHRNLGHIVCAWALHCWNFNGRRRPERALRLVREVWQIEDLRVRTARSWRRRVFAAWTRAVADATSETTSEDMPVDLRLVLLF